MSNTPSGDPKDKWRVRHVRELREDTYEVEVDRTKSGFLVARVYPDGDVSSGIERLSGAEMAWFRHAVEKWKRGRT